ncbi:ABZJ_00895 family protein [Kordiimonas aestuarii]|uniref:ABZJ_00895 family protein n=1 Tax=Kordiimonas aestuarii TaxID=1005925 RepID=UPI0021D17BC6|nr:ABZJ_00895 family protein [Kordiimonas aestuarii]
MSEQATESKPVELRSYLVAFTIWYMCALLALTGVSFGLGIGFGHLGNIVILVIAAIITGVRFADDNGREFAGAEKWKLGLFCLLVSHLLSTLNTALVTLLFLSEEERQGFWSALQSMQLDAWAFSIAIVSFFYYVAIVLFLGVGATNRLKKLQQGTEG